MTTDEVKQPRPQFFLGRGLLFYEPEDPATAAPEDWLPTASEMAAYALGARASWLLGPWGTAVPPADRAAFMLGELVGREVNFDSWVVAKGAWGLPDDAWRGRHGGRYQRVEFLLEYTLWSSLHHSAMQQREAIASIPDDTLEGDDGH